MTFVVKLRGAPRPILKEFRCPVHGVFEALVDSGAEETFCTFRERCTVRGEDVGNVCGRTSPWSPSLIPMRVRRFEAVKGKDEKPEHPDWDFTRNLEEGQDFDDWQADRDAAAEERRKALVMEMARSD